MWLRFTGLNKRGFNRRERRMKPPLKRWHGQFPLFYLNICQRAAGPRALPLIYGWKIWDPGSSKHTSKTPQSGFIAGLHPFWPLLLASQTASRLRFIRGPCFDLEKDHFIHHFMLFHKTKLNPQHAMKVSSQESDPGQTTAWLILRRD